MCVPGRRTECSLWAAPEAEEWSAPQITFPVINFKLPNSEAHTKTHTYTHAQRHSDLWQKPLPSFFFFFINILLHFQMLLFFLKILFIYWNITFISIFLSVQVVKGRINPITTSVSLPMHDCNSQFFTLLANLPIIFWINQITIYVKCQKMPKNALHISPESKVTIFSLVGLFWQQHKTHNVQIFNDRKCWKAVNAEI